MNLHEMLLASKLVVGGGGGGTGGGDDNFPIGDGNTHIWISLAEGRTRLKLGICVKGTATVDWGDGSDPDVLTGTSTTKTIYTPYHDYGKSGEYIITLTVDGNITISSPSSSSDLLLMSDTSTDNINRTARLAIKKVEIGTSTLVSRGAFGGCAALEMVDLGNIVTLGQSAFRSCNSLRDVVIPDSFASFDPSVFYYCYSLAVVKFPPSVTLISSDVFYDCYGAAVFDFSQHTSIPTAASNSTFTGLPNDCIFKIPASLYDEWIAATNWAYFAQKWTFVGV